MKCDIEDVLVRIILGLFLAVIVILFVGQIIMLGMVMLGYYDMPSEEAAMYAMFLPVYIFAMVAQEEDGISLTLIARDERGRIITEERVFLSRDNSESTNNEKLNIAWEKIMRALEKDALKKQKQRQLRKAVENFLLKKLPEEELLM